MGVRNKVAHIGGQDLDDDYTWRALDTMSRLCEAFDDDSAEEIRTLARELRYGSAQGSTTVTAANAESSAKPTSVGVMTHQNGLPSWRTIMGARIPMWRRADIRMPNSQPIWHKLQKVRVH